MIDLTPLDVRKKKGDFRRGLRGYEAPVVDDFLDLVAERLEELVRENMALRERATQLGDSVTSYRDREQAMNEALVSAQQLREEIRAQAAREAELELREARGEAERIIAEARREAAAMADAARRVHAQRAKYLRTFRTLVERQLEEIDQEETRLQEAPPQGQAAPPQGEAEGRD